MSFIRQLNLYGFRKKSRSLLCFFHPQFQRGDMSMIENIERRILKKNTNVDYNNELMENINLVKKRVEQLEEKKLFKDWLKNECIYLQYVIF